MRLIVGLGNPGKQYERTRHNVGFVMLDHLREMLERAQAWKEESDFRALVCRGQMNCCEDVLLVKPHTYMNASGQAVAAVSHYYKLPSSDLLLIHDEIALPLGELRLSFDATAANHNGVQSVIDALGTKAFWRLRIGIGPQDGKSEDFVLENFRKEELPLLHQTLERALKGVEEIFTNGPTKAQNEINTKKET